MRMAKDLRRAKRLRSQFNQQTGAILLQLVQTYDQVNEVNNDTDRPGRGEPARPRLAWPAATASAHERRYNEATGCVTIFHDAGTLTSPRTSPRMDQAVIGTEGPLMAARKPSLSAAGRSRVSISGLDVLRPQRRGVHAHPDDHGTGRTTVRRCASAVSRRSPQTSMRGDLVSRAQRPAMVLRALGSAQPARK